jgi:uncharacterized protein YjiS (DUF1127 family)
MSVHTADSQLSFRLPSLSYIDAKWEEPSLRIQPAAPKAAGLVVWLSRQVSAFSAWRRDSAAAAELASMSDHELMDIGLSRADISRVFDREANLDLVQRGLYA